MKIKQKKSTQRSQVQASATCKILKWTLEQYHDHYLDQAKAWLMLFFDNDESIVEMLYTENLFWKWWRNQWLTREAVWLEYASLVNPVNHLGSYYVIHSAKTLNVRPHRPVMEDMLERINQGLKEQIKKQNAAVYHAQKIIDNAVLKTT